MALRCINFYYCGKPQMQNETFQLPSVFFKVLQRDWTRLGQLVELAEIERHTKFNIRITVSENKYLKIIFQECSNIKEWSQLFLFLYNYLYKIFHDENLITFILLSVWDCKLLFDYKYTDQETLRSQTNKELKILNVFRWYRYTTIDITVKTDRTIWNVPFCPDIV